MGCAVTPTHFGVTMTGSRSTREEIISKDRLPDPMTMEARNSTTCTPEARRISANSSFVAMIPVEIEILGQGPGVYLKDVSRVNWIQLAGGLLNGKF